MRTVHVTATVKLILKINDDTEVGKVMDEIEISKTTWHKRGCHDSFDIEDSRIEGAEVTDSH